MTSPEQTPDVPLTAAYCQRRAAQALDKAQEYAAFESGASLNATAAGWHQLSQELRWVEQAAIEAAAREREATMRPCRCIKEFQPTAPMVDLDALEAHVATTEDASSREALQGL